MYLYGSDLGDKKFNLNVLEKVTVNLPFAVKKMNGK